MRDHDGCARIDVHGLDAHFRVGQCRLHVPTASDCGPASAKAFSSPLQTMAGWLALVDAAVDLFVLDSPDPDTVRLVVSNLVAANETVAPPEEYQPLDDGSMEDAARRRGVGAAHVDTYDFQALEFCERLGWAVFGKLDDFPVGHTRFFLQKSLA